MYTKIKVFSATLNNGDIEKKVNSWLKEHSGICVKQVTPMTTQRSIMVVYEAYND